MIGGEYGAGALSVSGLNEYARRLLAGDPLLRSLEVSGEISGYKHHYSGHRYFSLKDDGARVQCVMFRQNAMGLDFQPADGMRVTARGSASIFVRDGSYQLYVSAMMPFGAGDLQMAFEQLKSKLDAEGLFLAAHKKELPAFPKRIALVTSPAGAAVRDMIRILGSRWPLAEVLVVPVRVQGTEAAGEIADAIRLVNENRLADLIITGRGGGSLEDLWAFNEETVARAIYASSIPVISAVGHEPDVTIADYTADMRASTPSNAAELAVPDREEMAARLKSLGLRAAGSMSKRLALSRKAVQELSRKRVLQRPEEFFSLRRMDLDMLRERMLSAEERLISGSKQRFLSCVSSLEAMSPLKVLSRGYTLVQAGNERMLFSAEEARKEEALTIRFHDGSVDCTVNERKL